MTSNDYSKYKYQCLLCTQCYCVSHHLVNLLQHGDVGVVEQSRYVHSSWLSKELIVLSVACEGSGGSRGSIVGGPIASKNVVWFKLNFLRVASITKDHKDDDDQEYLGGGGGGGACAPLAPSWAHHCVKERVLE